MKKRIILFAILVLFAIEVRAENTPEQNDVVQVEGTSLAHLNNVLEVLQHVPSIVVLSDNVIVVGYGTPAIFIDNRRIGDFSELKQILANSVKDIRVNQSPGSEYEKDVRSVIEIHLLDIHKEGLAVDNNLSFSLTHKLSTSDQLSLRWKRGGLMLNGFIGWDAERTRFHKDEFKHYYANDVLVKAEHDEIQPNIASEKLTARISAKYTFTPYQYLSFNYSLMSKHHNRALIPEKDIVGMDPNTNHDLAFEYATKLGKWNMAVGNNTFFDSPKHTGISKGTPSFYNRKEYDLRTYAKLSRPLWQGTIKLGAEHEFDHMEIYKYDDKPDYNEQQVTYNSIHAQHPDNVFALYASAKQELGIWTIEAGMRYEYINSDYKPCSDDGLLAYINDTFVNDASNGGSSYIIPALLTDEKVTETFSFLYPSLSVTAKLGESSISLKHSQSSNRPYLGLSRLHMDDLELADEKILEPERIATTTLGWNYKWLQISLAYMHYSDPICATLDESVSYNAQDYDALDLNVSVSPTIGIWSPQLNARLHTQWFDMPLADSKDRLHRPLLTIMLSNSLVLPANWRLFVNTEYHSCGGERNVYFFQNDFSLSASLQKELPRKGLTFILGATNILRNSAFDVTRYVKAYNGICEGVREERVRMVSFSIRWKF